MSVRSNARGDSSSLTFGVAHAASHRLPPGPCILPPGPNPTHAMVRFVIVREGALAHRDAGGRHATDTTHVLRRGDAIVSVDPARTTMLAIGDCTVLVLAVPVDVAQGLALATEGVARVPRDAPMLAPVTAFVDSALQTSGADLTSFDAYYFERLLQEMAIGLLVETQQAGYDAPRGRDTFTHALALIAAQHADGELAPHRIARDVSLSQRQLERVFREHGTTVGREIRRARVDAAMRLLRDPAYDALSVDQIAQFCGLSTGSSLARAMASEDAPSPSSVRAERLG